MASALKIKCPTLITGLKITSLCINDVRKLIGNANVTKLDTLNFVPRSFMNTNSGREN